MLSQISHIFQQNLAQLDEKKTDKMFDSHNLLGSVKIKVTRNCNLSCAYCQRGRQVYQDELKIHHLRDLFHDIKELGGKKVHFSGGEFFIRPDWEEILTSAADSKLSISITSNGTLINEKVLSKLKAYPITSMQLSLDSFSEQIHNQMRGKANAFSKTFAAIALLDKEAQFISLGINIVATKLFYQNIDYFSDFIKTYPRISLLLLPLKTSEKNDPHLPHWQDVIKFEERLAIEKIPVKRSLQPYGVDPKEIQYSLRTADFSGNFYKDFVCFAPWTHSYVHDNGKVSLCCHRPDNIFLGNIREERFIKLFQSADYTLARKRHIEKKISRCQKCEMFQKDNRFLYEKIVSHAQSHP